MYGKYECFVMHMLYVSDLCASCDSSQFCILHDMLVEYARGDHKKEAYSRVCLMTALYVAISVSFCLSHPVAMNAFIISSGE